MLMLAGAGSGKTHMIDEIPRSSERVLEWKEKQLKEAVRLVETAIATDISVDPAQKALLEARKLADQSLLDDLAEIKKEIKETIFFVPISFNSHIRVEFAENYLGVEDLLVSRILFCYFCIGLDFQAFRKTFQDLFPKISVRTALDAIRYDQSCPSSEETPKPFKTSRAVLLIDEIAKVVSTNNPGVSGETRRENLYSLLRQVFLGIYGSLLCPPRLSTLALLRHPILFRFCAQKKKKKRTCDCGQRGSSARHFRP